MNRIIEEDIDIMLKDDLPWTSFRGSTVLITGAYGMLASYLVYALMALNARDPSFNVRILAAGRSLRRMKERFGDRPDGNCGLHVIQSGAEALASREDLPGTIDYIIHAASPTNPRSYLTDPTAVIEANVTATRDLLRLGRARGTKAFLYISSGEVYGLLHKAVIREEDGGTYTANDPRNVYALSKRLGERLCEACAAGGSMRVMCVRPSHTYGPTMSLDTDGRVFADFVKNAVEGRDIVMTSDGTASRAFTYLTDAALGYFRVLLLGKSGEAYNVTNNDGIRTIRALAEIVAALAVPPVRTAFGQPDASYRENANRQASIRSTERLESLGWHPSVSPEEGFARTVNSFLS